MKNDVLEVKLWANWKVITRWLMDNGYEECQVCGQRNNLTFDHIIPFSFGGLTEIDNLGILCKRCNESKGNNYWPGLKSVEWPRPYLQTIEIQDLTPGDHTVYGIVQEIPKVHSQQPQFTVWKCATDGKAIFQGFGQTVRKRTRKFGNTIYRPEGSLILLHPSQSNGE